VGLLSARPSATRKRLQLTRAGGVFSAGIVAIGFAAVNTGNNLLFLLLGAMVGAMVLSWVISRQVLLPLSVVRRVPRGVHAGELFSIRHELSHTGGRIPAFAVDVGERGLAGCGFATWVPPLGHLSVGQEAHFVRRGTFPLTDVVLATSAPFGLLRRERNIPLPGELVIWPRIHPGPEVEPEVGEVSGPSAPSGERGAPARGEYRSSREFRVGDSPRDLDRKASLRTGRAVVREYEREGGSDLWVALDLSLPAGDEAEAEVERVAGTTAAAIRRGLAVGLRSEAGELRCAPGEAQLEAILTALARVDFLPGGASDGGSTAP